MADTQTSAPAVAAGHDEAHDDHHPTPGMYAKVALVLSVLTVMEFSTYYIDFGRMFAPMLLILMTIKFFIIARMFMHLKFDNAVFSRLMYAGLGLALGLYLIVLAALAEIGYI